MRQIQNWSKGILLLSLLIAVCGGPVRANAPLTILAFGDSLTAGWGLEPGQAFPALLEAKLKVEGFAARVVNAGVSGETAAQGARRLAFVLDGERPDAAILCLGANDALQGLDPERMRDRLDAMLGEFAKRGIPVLFAGMRAPINLGESYKQVFDSVFPELAAKWGVAFYPFLLEGVARDPALNLPDGIHPNAKGQAVIAAGLHPLLKEMLFTSRGVPK